MNIRKSTLNPAPGLPHEQCLQAVFGYAPEYLFELSNLQINALSKTNNETRRFTEAFDYNSKSKGIKASSEAVPNAINKLKGKLI